jgi:putative Ca2+/H+ antiporter (TMEM165/GDT1 family)
MLDRDRRSARRGLRNSGVVVIVLAMAGFALFAALFGHLGDIPLLVPAAVLMTGFLFVIFGHTMSILSSRGAETAAAWRARQRELQRVARERLEPKELARWLPAAAGFGLAGPMLKAAKASGTSGAVPIAWLSELSDPSAALVVIMAATSSGAHAGGAGGGGAAGGGSSSAR